MAKDIRKTLRLSSEIADRVAALKTESEPESAVYIKAIETGLDLLEGKTSDKVADKMSDMADETADNWQTEPKQADSGEVGALKDLVSVLKDEVSSLKDQLDKKDELIDQIQSRHEVEFDKLHQLANQAQRAHQTQTLALAKPKVKKSLPQRIKEWFVGEKPEPEPEQE